MDTVLVNKWERTLLRLAMTAKNADRQFILEFIEVYRSLPALWDVKSKDYSNRMKKNEQYDILIEKYREIFPDADKLKVKKKINSLRTNFRKEIKRLRNAAKSGAATDDVESSLWYFEEMRFLQSQETPTASTSSMNPVPDTWLGEDAPCEDTNEDINDRASSESNSQCGPVKKKKNTGDISQQLMECACSHLQKPRDDNSLTTAAWSVELNKMETTQQILAKKFINDIIFEGQMGTLHRDSVVINNYSRESTPYSIQSLNLSR